MLFRTLLEPKTYWLPRVNRGGRGFYLGGAFEVFPDPAAEGIAFTEKRRPNFPLEFQPAITAAIARASAQEVVTGQRLCSLRLEIDSLKFHDVDTTEEGVEKLTSRFVLNQLWDGAIPVAASGEWISRDVLDVARGYRSSADLPILADALEDAGCSEERIMRHLRECVEHGERCWVVDLLLARAANPTEFA